MHAERPLRFSTIVLDVDSTLSRTEGIDWLAERRGPGLKARIREVTDRAMNGEITLQSVYQQRLEMIRPTRNEISLLGDQYISTAMPGALEAVQYLRGVGVHLLVVSGGIREAIVPLAAHLGIVDINVHAVSLAFSERGEYLDFDRDSPLARNGGKPVVVRALNLTGPILALGDGISDAELKTDTPPSVDAFAAFVGAAERAPVARVADYIVHRFSQLPAILQP